jgi:hypothetical protein
MWLRKLWVLYEEGVGKGESLATLLFTVKKGEKFITKPQ